MDGCQRKLAQLIEPAGELLDCAVEQRGNLRSLCRGNLRILCRARDARSSASRAKGPAGTRWFSSRHGGGAAKGTQGSREPGAPVSMLDFDM